METGRRGERKIVEPASSKQQRLFSRCALAYSLGVPLSKTYIQVSFFWNFSFGVFPNLYLTNITIKKRGLRFSAASHCRINNGSAGLDERKRIVKSHVTWNGTGCLLTFSKTTLLSKIRLDRHGCLQDKSQLLDVLCLNIQRKQPSIWPLYQQWSGLLLSIRKGKWSKAREKEVVPSSLVTRHHICRKRGSGEGRTTV